MKQIQKFSLIVAQQQFWRELKDLGLSDKERMRLMEKFKESFNRSYDYDLAASSVLEDLVNAKKEMTFKEVFGSIGKKKISKGLFDFLSGEQGKARRMIDEEFEAGKREVDILDALLLAGSNFYKRPLTQEETDKLRFLVISEKVKLDNKGVKINE